MTAGLSWAGSREPTDPGWTPACGSVLLDRDGDAISPGDLPHSLGDPAGHRRPEGMSCIPGMNTSCGCTADPGTGLARVWFPVFETSAQRDVHGTLTDVRSAHDA